MPNPYIDPLVGPGPSYSDIQITDDLRKKRFELEREVELSTQRLTDHEGYGDIAKGIRERAKEPGFWETYIFGPITAVSEFTARTFTGGEVFRGGELLRRDTETGVAGWETVQAPDISEGLKTEITRAPIGKFSDKTSEGIISQAILNFWEVENEPRAETFIQGVKGIATDPYNSKTIDRLIKTGASTAQFLSELVLDTVTDPLAVFTMIKPVHLMSRGGSKILPSMRRLTLKQLTPAEQAKRIIKGGKAEKSLGVQLAGHGVIAAAARATVKAGKNITHGVLKDALGTLVPNRTKAADIMRKVDRAYADVRHKIAQATRSVDGLAYFRTLDRRTRLRLRYARNGYHGVMNNIPLLIHTQAEHVFRNVKLNTDKASTKIRSFMAEVLDETVSEPDQHRFGHLVDITDKLAVENLPHKGARSKLISSTDDYLPDFYVADYDALLAKLQKDKYKGWVKETDLQGILEDSWRAKNWLSGIAREETRRGLLGAAITNYVPRIFKSRYHLERAKKAGLHEDAWGAKSKQFGFESTGEVFLPFNQARGTSEISLARLEHLGYKPEMDLAKLIEMRASNFLTNKAYQDYVQGMVEIAGDEAMKYVPHLLQKGLRVAGDFDTVLTKPAGVLEPYTGLGYKQPIASVSESLFDVSATLGEKGMVGGKQANVSKMFIPLSQLTHKKAVDILEYPALSAAKTIGLNVDEIAIPRVLYKELEKTLQRKSSFRKFFQQKILGQMLEAQTQLWRRLVTVANPAFYATNILGDTANAFLELGVAALNPKTTMKTVLVLQGSTKQIRFGKVSKTGAEWLEEVRQGGMTGTFEQRIQVSQIPGGEGGRILQAAEGIRQTVGAPLRHLRETFVSKKQTGQLLEEFSRTQLYLNARNKGFTPEGAVDTVYNTLFNYYHGLTDFERDVMRRVVPFYTFLRYNAAFQMKKAIVSPSRVIAADRASRAMEAGNSTYREFLFPYENALTTIGGTTDEQGRPQVLGLRLPVKEFWARLPKRPWDPESVVQSLQEWMQVLHPGLQGGIKILQYQAGAGWLPPTGQSPGRLWAESKNFGPIFRMAPTQVKEWLGVVPWQTPAGEKTWVMDAQAWGVITTVGFARLLSSFGLLERAGLLDVDLTEAEELHYGGEPTDTYQQWTSNDLTKMQGIISAIFGQPLRPWGEKQVEQRTIKTLREPRRRLQEQLKYLKGTQY